MSKKIETLEIYICDCCGIKMITQPCKFIIGHNSNGNGVSYEPKVMGDYCRDCIEFAQDDWDLNNTSGFVHERYDPITEDDLKVEIEKMIEVSKREE